MIDDLIEALENFQDAKAEYNKACEKCEYDRDYFLHRQIDDVNHAKNELARIFKEVVLEIVKEK